MPKNGVGDDDSSYAYDGNRLVTWHKYSESEISKKFGELWDIGDIIGVCIDLDRGSICFYQNGKFLGEAYNDVEIGPNKAYFPGISMVKGQRVEFNFGASGLRYSYYPYQQMDIPEGVYKGTNEVATYLLDFIKTTTLPFLMLKDTPYHYKITMTYKVFCYLFTLLQKDNYIVQEYFLPFLINLDIDQMNLLFENLLMYDKEKERFDFVSNLFNTLCKKIENYSLTPTLFENWQINFDLFRKLLDIDVLVHIWLDCSYFDENIKMIFSWDYAKVNLISQIYNSKKQSVQKDTKFKHFHKQVLQTYYEQDLLYKNEQIAAEKFKSLILYCVNDTRDFKRGRTLRKLLFENFFKRVLLKDQHFYHQRHSDDMFIKNFYFNSLSILNEYLTPENYGNFTIEPFIKRKSVQSIYYDMLGIGGTISHVTSEYLDKICNEYKANNKGLQNVLLHDVLNVSNKYILQVFYELANSFRSEEDRTVENFEVNEVRGRRLKNILFRKMINLFTYRTRKVIIT
jgi:hypothetical protein